MRLAARSTVDGLLAALLAASCPVCARVCDQPTAGAVCEACWRSVPFITPPFCGRCGDPLPPGHAVVGDIGAGGSSAETRCHTCVTRGRALDSARALGAYQGTLRDVLHALKYSGRRSIAPRLGALMRQRCGDVLLGAAAVVPVPLHRRRQWTRGFNQATEIARHLGLPVLDVLRRTKVTARQADLPAAERWDNVREAFAVRRRVGWRRPQSRIRGACLVIIDDVTTTGATLEACAEALKQGGASEVRALTAARTLLRQG